MAVEPALATGQTRIEPDTMGPARAAASAATARAAVGGARLEPQTSTHRTHPGVTDVMTNLAASDRTGTRRRNSGAHKPTRSLNEARIDVGGVDERLDEIVRTHSARVYRLAYRLTGNQHDAEDLTQEVFIRVFRSLHTHTPATFEGWLCRITTHIFLDDIRRTTRLLTVTVGTWDTRN